MIKLTGLRKDICRNRVAVGFGDYMKRSETYSIIDAVYLLNLRTKKLDSYAPKFDDDWSVLQESQVKK